MDPRTRTWLLAAGVVALVGAALPFALDAGWVKIAGGIAALLAAAVMARPLIRAAGWGKALGATVAIGAACVGILHVVTGAPGEPAGELAAQRAERALEDRGFTEILLVPRPGGERFELDAVRGDERCTGEVRLQGGRVRMATHCVPSERVEVAERDCEAGDARRCAEAAARLRETPPIDWARATASSARACEGGEERECLYVGMAHELGGRGLPRDRAAALAMYERACAAGAQSACARAAALR